MQDIQKAPKKKGPIRWEALVPITVIMVVAYAYFAWYFDLHMKKLIEYVGTQANGAEVNVAAVRTSFLRADFNLDGLQVTDKEVPARNLISIGNIHFRYLWDALLRMKFVVDDASINNIQAFSPRKHPGKVLPPSPASPSKIEAMEKEVLSQLQQEYSHNMLGDVLSLLEGADPKDQLEKIRAELKTEARLKEMIADVNAKQTHWQGEIKRLSDDSKLKEIEVTVRAVKTEKNFLKQVKLAKDAADDLKALEKQAKEIQTASKELESEFRTVSAYPKEVEALAKQDMDALKSHFKIPQIEVKDLAMSLFGKEFGHYLVKARKYQALAKQYLPEKKEREVVVPPPRSTGHNYEFPITVSYPLFWLKRAAISSNGTADSFNGRVSGELTNVTTSPKWVRKPIILDLKGDFPAVQVHGVEAKVTADFTNAIHQERLDLKVGSFAVPEKMFSQSDKLKFGIKGAQGASTLNLLMHQGEVNMRWNGTISNPQWVVETPNKIAHEILSGVVQGIPRITIDGSATGAWKHLSLHMSSNLGDELSKGFKDQIGRKVAEAEAKIRSMVDEKIKEPLAQLNSHLKGNGDLLSKSKDLSKLWKDNESKLKAELAKIQKGGSGKNNLQEQGKKLLKGFKL